MLKIHQSSNYFEPKHEKNKTYNLTSIEEVDNKSLEDHSIIRRILSILHFRNQFSKGWTQRWIIDIVIIISITDFSDRVLKIYWYSKLQHISWWSERWTLTVREISYQKMMQEQINIIIIKSLKIEICYYQWYISIIFEIGMYNNVTILKFCNDQSCLV